MTMPTLLTNATIITPFEVLSDAAILINKQGLIDAVGQASDLQQTDANIIDVNGKIIIPGLIDMHVHGGYGISFGLGRLPSELKKYQRWVCAFGETGFVVTLTGPDMTFLENAIKAYAGLMPNTNIGAQPLGLHLEGPFLNPNKHGAYNPDWIHNPSVDEIQHYLQAGKGRIKQMTLAPELPLAGEAAEMLSRSGIVVAMGHTDTDYDIAAAALKGPYTHVTHVYNAQSPLNHRKPGVVGAILSSDTITAELIADGFHIHPAAMKILVRCLGSERIVLITDAMPGTGMPDGEYELLGQKVNVRDGKATMNNGTLGGSTATMNQCVRNMVEMAGVPFNEAVRMGSTNPAKVLGIDTITGSLEPGKQADLAVVDESMNVFMTFVKGKQVYQKKNLRGKQ